MKKTLLILAVLCLCFGTTSWANNNTDKPPRPHFAYGNADKDNCEGRRVNFGFSFAPTLNWMFPQMETEDYERNGVAGGFRAGIPLNINLTTGKFYYVSTGVFFERIDGKMKFLDNIQFPESHIDSVETRRRYDAHYLTIPIGITLKTKSLSNFYICGNAGLYAGFCLKNYKQDSYNMNTSSKEEDLWSRQRELSNEASIFRAAAYIGLGFEYSVTKDLRAGLFINYNHGFTNYFKGKGKAQNSMTGIDQKAKIGGLEIVLNINFF